MSSYDPISLMEAALVRKLRSRRSLTAHGVEVSLVHDGGARISKDGILIGTWRWDGQKFQFMNPDTGETVLEVNTIMAASAHTASMLED
jgi:hypothetical protein